MFARGPYQHIVWSNALFSSWALACAGFQSQRAALVVAATIHHHKSQFLFTPDGQISFSGRIQILEDGGVLIAKVRTTDRGKYTCTRANEAGSVTGDAWLEVLVRTQIILPPVDTKVILGHVASMSCKVSADNNVPFEVSWYHDGRLIDDDASYRKGSSPFELS